MNFLYFVKQPLTERDWVRYGIGFMIEHGHRVTVMDLSDPIHPKLPNKRFNDVHNKGAEVHVIKDWADFKAKKNIINECDLVIFLIQSYGLSRSTYLPLKLLAECGKPYLITSPALYPGWRIQDSEQPFSQYLKDLWGRFSDLNVLNSLISRLAFLFFKVRKAAFMVKRSDHKKWSNSLVGPKTKVIEAHTDDYEIFLEEKKRGAPINNQAVFLDQFMPFHVDFLELNSKHIDADAYFDGLRRLFSRIERELEIEVVVAAHPRADYHKQPRLYGDRRIVYGSTVSLIAESRLVLAHNSTAIGFAVAFNKPVMLLTNQALYHYQVYEKYAYDALSNELGTPLRFYDDPESVDLSGAFNVDSDLYERYRNIYLKCPNAPTKPFWGNILDMVEAT